VLAYLDGARFEGVDHRLRRRAHAELGGLFVRPTVVLADPDSTIVREEAFGPVLAAYTFTDEDDAVRLRADFLAALCADIVAKRSAAGGGPATALRW
jgi:aldehyde dehydrogenase (NAD+)